MSRARLCALSALVVPVITAAAAVTATPLAGQDARADTVRPAPAEAWLGEDKVRHFGASLGMTLIGYGGARTVLAHDPAIGVALGAAAVAGLLREVHDDRRGRWFSVRDLVWDALGIAAGYLWIREIQ